MWFLNFELILQFFVNFWAFLLLCGLVSNMLTTFFRGLEVCLERCDPYGNFGYLEKNQTFYSRRIFLKNTLSLY